MPAGRNSGAPVYLACEELRAHQRRNIALMRTQAAAFVATHAQRESGTMLFNSGTEYAHRHCIQPSCLGKNITDSTEHVMLSCPEHRALRRAMRMDIDTTCPPKAGAAMAPSADLQVLLGTRPPDGITSNSAKHADVLRASANFIHEVYRARWPNAQAPPCAT
jgi:hypothetical protein